MRQGMPHQRTRLRNYFRQFREHMGRPPVVVGPILANDDNLRRWIEAP